jgi:hypothetical protein
MTIWKFFAGSLVSGLLLMLPAAPAQAQRAPTNYPIWTWLECPSDWDNECDDSVELSAPEGFQVCQVVYTVASAGRGTPDHWATVERFANGDSVPRRIFSMKLHLRSKGSHNPLDRWGSNIRVENVGLTILPNDATPDERYSGRCNTSV